MPERLSELGCFDRDARWLAPGVIPFDVNAPLWSDDAEKERWFAIPDAAVITTDSRGDFAMPGGSVMGKTFSLAGQRVETRIMMNHPQEGYRGYSYRWNADQTDATLSPEDGEVILAGNAQAWTIPSRSDCSSCHTAETGYSLGLELAQLQRTFTYPNTGRVANQVDTLRAVGVLAPSPTPNVPTQQLVDYRDLAQPTATRARSYLHANCASCHTTPASVCTGDFRWDASDAQMGVCEQAPKIALTEQGADEEQVLLAPGSPERSVIVHRMRAPGGSLTAMPPLGRHGVHEAGVQLIEQWIREMPGCTP